MMPRNSSWLFPICWVKWHNMFGMESQIQRRDSFSAFSSTLTFSLLANATKHLCSGSLGLPPTETFILRPKQGTPSASTTSCKNYTMDTQLEQSTFIKLLPNLAKPSPRGGAPFLQPDCFPSFFFIISRSREVLYYPKPKAPITLFAMKLYRRGKGDLRRKWTYEVFIHMYETNLVMRKLEPYEIPP